MLLLWLVRDESEQHVDGDDVDDEGVAAPRGHHVEIGKRRPDCPEDAASVAGLEENIKRENEREDGHTLVVI